MTTTTTLDVGSHPHSGVTIPPVPTRLFIGGEWRDAAGGATFAVHDPATGGELCRVADATVDDARAAMDAAAAAQEAWGRTAPRVRGELLRSAFELVTERADDFAVLMSLEMGKPLEEARGEVAYGAEFLRWFSEEAVRIAGRYQMAPDGKSRILVTKRPVGPSFFITPWNFPLAMATRKIAPAIAAGCTSILKPAALTPLTALAFVALLEEVGVPAGVVNIIPTSDSKGVGKAVLGDPRLRKLSFTGSTEVGKSLLAQAAKGVLRTSMELGGNAPFVVFEDADVDLAVQGATTAKLRNMGEACTAANRFFVHESVADEFAQKLAERFASMQVGPGLASGSKIGPLVSEDARRDVHDLVAGSLEQGARALAGGHIPVGAGWFYPPTVLVDVPRDATILDEEIFGPVAPIVRFSTEDEAVQMCNRASVGLAGYLYTRDNARVLRLIERLEVGMIGVNQGLISNAAAPFGGIKESGMGREGGSEGIEEYLDTIYVGIADPTE